MPVTDLDDTGAFAREGAGASRSGDVALTRGEVLRIVVGHDGFEGDPASASGDGQRRRVRGRGGECGKASPGRRSRDQGEEVETRTST